MDRDMERRPKPSALLLLVVSTVIAAARFDVANAKRTSIFYERGTTFHRLLTCPLETTDNSTLVWRSSTKTKKILIQPGETTSLATAYANGSIDIFHSSSLRVPEQQLWSYSCERVTHSSEGRHVLERSSEKYNVVALDPPPSTAEIAIDSLHVSSAVVHWRLARACSTALRYARCDGLHVELREAEGAPGDVTEPPPRRVDIPVGVGATTGSRKLSNLKRNTRYSVAVQAYSAALERGGKGKSVEFRTPRHGLLLLYPKDVKIKVLNLTAMEVSWKHVHSPTVPLTGYFVKYSIEGALRQTTVAVAADRNALSVAGLEPGNTYAFSVHSYSTLDASGQHLDSIAATASRRLPRLHASAAATNASAMTVAWRILAGSLDYVKVTVGGGDGEKKITLYPDLSAGLVTVGGRTPGRRYTVRLVGKKNGERAEAVKLDVTMPSLPLLTGEHVKIEVLPRQKRIRVTFSVPPVYRDAGPLSAVQLKLSRQLDISGAPPFERAWRTYAPAERTASLHDDIEVGRYYQLRVRARYERAGTTEELLLPFQIPFTVVPVAGTPVIVVTGASAVNVTWKRLSTNNSVVDGYNVSFRLVGEDNWEFVPEEIPPSANLTTVRNLLDGAEYEFRVQVYANGQYSAPRVARAALSRMPLTPRPLRVHARAHADGVTVDWTRPADSLAFARKSFNLDLSPALGAEKWTSLRLPPNTTSYFFDPTRYADFAVNVPYRMRMRAEYYQRGTTESVVGSEKTAEQVVVATGVACCRVPLGQQQRHADVAVVRQLVIDARSTAAGGRGIAVRWYPPARRSHGDHIAGYKIYYKFTAAGAPISGDEFSQTTVFYPRREVVVPRPPGAALVAMVMTVRVSAMNTDGDGEVSDAVFAALAAAHDGGGASVASPSSAAATAVTSPAGVAASGGDDEALTVPLLIGAGLAVVVVAMTAVGVAVFVRYSKGKRRAAHRQRLRARPRSGDDNGKAGVGNGAVALQHSSLPDTHLHRAKPSRNAPLHDFMIAADASGQLGKPESVLAVQYSDVQCGGSNGRAVPERNGAACRDAGGAGDADTLRSAPAPTQLARRDVERLNYADLDFDASANASSAVAAASTASTASTASSPAVVDGANTTTAPSSHNTSRQSASPAEAVAAKSAESRHLAFGVQRQLAEQDVQFSDELHQRIDYRLPHLVAFPVASASDFSSNAGDDDDYDYDVPREPTPLKRRPAAEGAGRHDVTAGRRGVVVLAQPPETVCREAAVASRTTNALAAAAVADDVVDEDDDLVSCVQLRGSSAVGDYGRAFTPRPSSVASIRDIPVERGEVSC